MSGARARQSRLTVFIKKPTGRATRSTGEAKEAKAGLRGVEVPSAIIEGVAGELKAPVTIIEPLVDWIVSYLNRPCCWSVGLDRLALDLLRARGDDVRFALYVLGVEVGERKVTDDGFAKLRSVLLVIIKYLELAGVVEYVRDLGVVNLRRAG
jgi:hypothetical protein